MENDLQRLIARNKRYFSGKLAAFSFTMGAAMAYLQPVHDLYANYAKDRIEKQENITHLRYKLSQLKWYQSSILSGDKWKKSSELHPNDPLKFAPSDMMKLLYKEGGVAIPPAVFHNPTEKETVTLIHTGVKTCGYPFIVHGGLISMILNEASHWHMDSTNKRLTVSHMALNYHKPSIASDYLKVRTTEKTSTRKELVLHHEIESASGEVLVTSETQLK